MEVTGMHLRGAIDYNRDVQLIQLPLAANPNNIKQIALITLVVQNTTLVLLMKMSRQVEGIFARQDSVTTICRCKLQP